MHSFTILAQRVVSSRHILVNVSSNSHQNLIKIWWICPSHKTTNFRENLLTILFAIFCLQADKQTDRQPDKQRWKHHLLAEVISIFSTYLSNGSNIPFAMTKSRHSGLSPATLPSAQTAWSIKEYLIITNYSIAIVVTWLNCT